MAKLVRIEELRELLGVSVATLRRYRASGMPVHGVTVRGRPSLFDAPACIAWYVDQQVADRVAISGEELLDLDQERARLAHAQADKTELEVKRIRGELVHVDEISQAWQIIATAVRQAFLTLANRVGPRLFAAQSHPELVTALHEEILAALAGLQDNGVPDVETGTQDDGAGATRH